MTDPEASHPPLDPPPRQTRTILLLLVGFALVSGGAGWAFSWVTNRAIPASPHRMVSILEKIAHDQELFREGDQEHDGQNDYGTLEELIAADLLIGAYGDGQVMGYALEVRVSETDPTTKWMAVANPVSMTSQPPPPYFVVNQEGVVYTVPTAASLSDTCEIPSDATPY